MALERFVREYRTIRRAEGWGSTDPAYSRALPYRDLTGRFNDIWRIRARSFDLFLTKVLKPLESRQPTLAIADVGAGSGWLAYRLNGRGHHVFAIDLLEDRLDGLGALRRYAPTVRPLVAEFDHLPLPAEQLDLVVFNASFHYSTDYATTLWESLRVLRAGGTLVILDSPMYSHPSSGTRMVKERELLFSRTYGFASTALPSEHFLTPQRLSELSGTLKISWQVHKVRLDWRSWFQRTIGGLRARREPARFPLIVATRP